MCVRYISNIQISLCAAFRGAPFADGSGRGCPWDWQQCSSHHYCRAYCESNLFPLRLAITYGGGGLYGQKNRYSSAVTTIY